MGNNSESMAILQIAQTYSNDTIATGRIEQIIRLLKDSQTTTAILALDVTIKNTTDSITAGRLEMAKQKLIGYNIIVK